VTDEKGVIGEGRAIFPFLADPFPTLRTQCGKVFRYRVWPCDKPARLITRGSILNIQFPLNAIGRWLNTVSILDTTVSALMGEEGCWPSCTPAMSAYLPGERG
jgi:hypothetical protein